MIWEKQIKRETGLGLALPCTRAVFIVFILLLVYYLFMHLSIYFFIRLLAGQSPILIEYSQPLFVWLSRD